MSELRHDLLARRWVIIATERSRRPTEFVVSREDPVSPKACPFCPGNEKHTPPEIAAIRPDGGKADGPGWEVRVFPNKYPALAIEGDPERRAVGIYDRQRGIGAHEVVVDSPEHDVDVAEMDPVRLEQVLSIYQDRLRDLYKDVRFKYALIFKNHGAAAGATLQHPHTQIIATPVTPRAIGVELDLAREHYFRKTRCIYCDILNQELESGDRVVAVDEHYAVLAPYASRFPFETMIIPRRHNHSFAEEPGASIAALARRMKDLMTRLKTVLRDPPYNYVFHTAPNTQAHGRERDYWYTLERDFHWHIEVLPRLTQVAGFEWGTGLFINPTAPEDAARFLRDAAV
jgi:UDPglucose--hexose-1-phosphate uridylyltransferase